MKKMLTVVILVSLILGCASKPKPDPQLSLVELIALNQENVTKLTVGMSKAEVLEFMGTKKAVTKNGLVFNPFKSGTFQDSMGAQCEILYYVTSRNAAFQPLRKEQTTPLVLKDNVLIGWGAEAVNRAMELQKTHISVEKKIGSPSDFPDDF